MSIRQSLVRLSASALVASLLQLVNGVLLARQLGAEGRGEYGELLFWAMTVNGLTNLGIFDSATTRLRTAGLDWKTEVASLQFFTAAAIALNTLVLVALGFGPWTAELGFDQAYVDDFVFYGMVVNTVFMLGVLERAQLEFSTLSLERVMTPATYSVLLAVLWLWGSNPHAAFVMLILANVPVLILRVARNARLLGGRFDRASVRAGFSSAMRFFSVAATLVIIGQIDKAIVLSLFDDKTVGNYFVAFSLVGAAYSLLVTALQTVVLPSMMGISVRDRRNRVERFGRLCLAGAVVMMVGVWLLADVVITILFGPDFDQAAAAARWIAVAMLLAPMIGMVESVQMSRGRNRWAIELHLVVIAVLSLSWALGLLVSVAALCVAFAAGRLLALVLALRHLAAYPLRVSPRRLLCFQPEDWREVMSLANALKKRLPR